ncbi:MAG: tyrosine-type recombinase/integrase [Moraxella sp.]|nr:tyrosine-type recombinase/integrase [Moraxella sp.]
MSNQKHSSGIEPLKKSIRIWWKTDGKRERVTLFLEPTEENLAVARSLSVLIKQQLQQGNFDKYALFPHLKEQKAERFGQYIEEYVEKVLPSLAPSSRRTHLSKIKNHIRPYWQNASMDEIDYKAVEVWVEKLKETLSLKTIKELIALWRAVWQRWARGKKVSDPTTYLKLPQSDPKEIDPYNKAEITKILSKQSRYHALWVVMLYSGLSTHELLGLAVEDVDLERGCLYVKRGIVDGVVKATKNRRRKREVMLLPIVLQALKEQMEAVCDCPARRVEVVERDNCTINTVRLKWLWQEEGKLLSYKQVEGRWRSHLKRCCVRFRPLNHGRHTYVSQVLSTGEVTADWLASQLGHASTQMIHRHYGRLIFEDSQHILERLSRRILAA